MNGNVKIYASVLETGKDERMEAYGSFAKVYDLFMDNVPYERWGEHLQSLLKRVWRGTGTGGGAGMRHRAHDQDPGRGRV